LSPLRDEHFPLLYSWNADPHILEIDGSDDPEVVRRIYSQASAAGYAFLIEYDGQAIGECLLAKRSNAPKSLQSGDLWGIDLIVGEGEYRGRGIGGNVIKILADFALKTKGLNEVYAVIAQNNYPSIKAFEKQGFFLVHKESDNLYYRKDKYMAMLQEIRAEVKRRCESDSNFFGMRIYYHIRDVAKYAVELAGLYGADAEICELAAWLHDIASITDFSLYEDHHMHGANMAQEILEPYNYPQEKIDLVKLCILNHRGSVLNQKSTKEEICVADADAISHFDTLPALFYLAFVKRGFDLDEGTKFVRQKLERSYNKMSNESKAHYKGKIEAVFALLG
jgi:uncharacterized protein